MEWLSDFVENKKKNTLKARCNCSDKIQLNKPDIYSSKLFSVYTTSVQQAHSANLFPILYIIYVQCIYIYM